MNVMKAPPLQRVEGSALASTFPFAVDGSTNSDADRRGLMAIDEAAQWLARDRPAADRPTRVMLRDRNTTSFARAGNAGRERYVALSDAETSRLVDGIERLRSRPFDEWTQRERNEFVGSNTTILHELGHLRTETGWNLEEGLLELAARGSIRNWMDYEYELPLRAADLVMPPDLDGYGNWGMRSGALLIAGGTSDAVTGATTLLRSRDMSDNYAAIAANLASRAGAPPLESQQIDEYIATGNLPGSPTFQQALRSAEAEAARLLA